MEMRNAVAAWLLAVVLGCFCLAVPTSSSAVDQAWSGTWVTRWRDGGAKLDLQQTGNRLTGTYPLYNGRVEGEIVGREFRGRWFEGDSRFGAFVFVLSPDSQSFMGRYDTGEWWTGERAKPERLSVEIDQKTPRRTLRTFLTAASLWREGAVDEIAKAVAVMDFGPRGDVMRPGERIEGAINLSQAIDLTTFRLWDIPGRSATDPEVRVTLHQSGTGAVLPLTLKRDPQGGNWRIAMPSQSELAGHMDALLVRSGGRRLPPDEHLRLKSPRATMQTFLAGFRDWDGSGRAQAVSTLDLSDVREAVRDHEGLLAAEYLKNVLARIGWVTLPEIPDDPNDRSPYVHFLHGSGKIVIAPQGEGPDTQWRFTAETVRDLRPLYAALEDMPVEDGARAPVPSSPYFVVREHIRTYAPWLLGRWGSIENWQAVAGIMALAVAIVATLLAAGVVRLGARLAGARHFTVRNRHLLWPLYVAIGCGVLLTGTDWLGLPNTLLEILQALVACVLAACVIWGGWRLIDMFSAAILPTLRRTLSSLDEILLSLCTTVAKIGLLVGGLIYVADALSIPYSGVLAGLGISGLAVAFASKETLSNVFGAAILAADRPFRRGDWISAGSTQGTVEHVGIRSTRIRTAEDSIVVVPNGKLADETINNLGTRRMRLFKLKVPLPLNGDPVRYQALTSGIRELFDGHEAVEHEKTQIGLGAFGDGNVELDLTSYLLVNGGAEERRVRHELILGVLQLTRQAGVNPELEVIKAA